MQASSSNGPTTAKRSIEEEFAHVGRFKIVMLGEQSVGKTAFVTRFLYDTFDESYQATIGVDFLAKTMYVNDRTVRLQMWDTAGQERFHSLIPAYIRDCSAAIILYDITKLDSFEWVDKWIVDVQRKQGNHVVLALIGNKLDLVQHKFQRRQVTIEEGQVKAQKYKALFYEVSAKTGYNVQHVFKKIAETCQEMWCNDVETPKGLNIDKQTTVTLRSKDTNDGAVYVDKGTWCRC